MKSKYIKSETMGWTLFTGIIAATLLVLAICIEFKLL